MPAVQQHELLCRVIVVPMLWFRFAWVKVGLKPALWIRGRLSRVRLNRAILTGTRPDSIERSDNPNAQIDARGSNLIEAGSGRQSNSRSGFFASISGAKNSTVSTNL